MPVLLSISVFWIYRYKWEQFFKVWSLSPRLMCVSRYVWTFDDEWTPSWVLRVTLALPLSDIHTISACITIDFSSLQACRKWHSGTVTSNAIHWDALNFACSLNRNQPMLPQKFILLNFTLQKYNYTYTNKRLKLSVTVTIWILWKWFNWFLPFGIISGQLWHFRYIF